MIYFEPFDEEEEYYSEREFKMIQIQRAITKHIVDYMKINDCLIIVEADRDGMVISQDCDNSKVNILFKFFSSIDLGFYNEEKDKNGIYPYVLFDWDVEVSDFEKAFEKYINILESKKILAKFNL